MKYSLGLYEKAIPVGFDFPKMFTITRECGFDRLHQLTVMRLLKFERGKLLVIIGRDTAIRTNPKEAIPFVWIDPRLCRNECLFSCVLPLIDLTQLLPAAIILHRVPPLCI